MVKSDKVLKLKIKHHKMKREKGSLALDIINYSVLIFIAIIMIYPIYYIIILSFNEGADAYQGGLFLWPRKFTLDNYITAFSNKQLYTSFLVTIIRTLIGTAISVIFIALMAYALSDKKLPGRRWMTKFFFFTTLFSGGAIPMLILIKDLDLLNKFMVYILPAIYGFTNMLIMKISFEGIPIEIKESAEIDGASDLRIFWSIYFPLSKSSLATIALFTAVFHWNDWYAGKYYVTIDALKPAATILEEIIKSSSASLYLSNNTTTTSQTLQAAFVVIIMVPIMMLYPFAQKYFVKGAIVGSIKE